LLKAVGVNSECIEVEHSFCSNAEITLTLFSNWLRSHAPELSELTENVDIAGEWF
jgi:hypothetical protein